MRVLVFHPQNPWPIRSGAHHRFWEIATALKELGYDIHVGGGRGLAMPAGVPRETLATMEAFAERVHKSAQWRDYATKNMYENTFLSSAALTQYLNKQMPAVGEFMSFIGSRKP